MTFIIFTAVQFQIVIQNRYKLNKKFRKVCPAGTPVVEPANDVENLEQRSLQTQAKVRCFFFNCKSILYNLSFQLN